MNIIDILVKTGITSSKSEAQRLLKSRAIKVDNRIVDKDFIFTHLVGNPPSAHPLEIKNVESHLFPEWYIAYLEGGFVDDPVFQAFGKIVTSTGAKGFDKIGFVQADKGQIAAMIVGSIFLISIGKSEYWVVRVNEGANNE